jgi:tetratricopeptide (TPR) repeat protein
VSFAKTSEASIEANPKLPTSYENALAFFTAALHNAESMQSSPGQWAATHLNMGQAHRKLKEYEKAINRRTLDLNPQNATAHSAIGSCYAMLGNNEEAILSYHEALAIHPGESMTTALLKLVLQDAVDTQTRDKISKNHTMKFPLLSDVVAEDLDARLAEEEEATFGKVLRIDANEKEGSMSPRTSKHKRGGKGIKAKTTPGRSSARRATAPTSEARQYEHSAAMDASQDMSIQVSSPNGDTSTNATPLPHIQAHYGYGGGNPASSTTTTGMRRMTRASTAHTGQYGQRQRGESEFESQGENVEQDEPTDRSYAGSDMVD